MPRFKIVDLLVLERRFFLKKVFAIYSHGGLLGHVSWTILYKLSFPIPMDAPYEVWLIGQAVSEENIFEIVNDDGR